MNVRALLIFLFLFSVTDVFCQLLIGPEAGVNLSGVAYDDGDFKNNFRIKPVWGYHAGVHVGFRVRKRFFLHFSLQYSTKGKLMESKSNVKNPLYDVQNLNNKVRYNYIDLPIVYTVDFKGRIGSNKEFKYNLGIGPIISYWLGGKGVIEDSDTWELHNGGGSGRIPYNIVFNSNSNSEPTQNQMVIQHSNRLQLGLNVTASIIFEPSPNRQIMVTARYEFGGTYLSSTGTGKFNSSTATIFQDPLQTHNRGLRISVAYLFDTKLDQRKRGRSTSKVKGKRNN